MAIGILVFLVWDVLTNAWEPVDAALSKHEWGTVASGGGTLAVGLTIGGRSCALRQLDQPPPGVRRPPVGPLAPPPPPS